MKQTLAGCLLFLIVGFAAGSAVGQGPQIALQNRTDKTLKICFYNGSDSVMLIPLKCYSAGSGKTITIVHGETEFGIRIYVPGFIDQHLYTYTKISNIYERISFGASKASFSKRPEVSPTPVRYILKVCNQTSKDPVYFVLSFDDGKTIYSKGWWVMDKDHCKDFPVSRILNEDWKVSYGTLPRTHYYARTYGETPLVWEGGVGDQQNCIPIAQEFKKAVLLESISAGAIACENSQFTRKVQMRRLPDPKVTEQYYYLTF